MKQKPEWGPAVDVINRVLLYLSVSALTRFDIREFGGCETKYYLRYVDRVPEEKKIFQETGTTVHAQIEKYLVDGADVLGDVARAGKHFLPEPGKDLFVEFPLAKKEFTTPDKSKFKIVSCLHADGVPIVGDIDIINPRGWFIDEDGVLKKDPEGTIEAIDNKTSSNIGLYAKTAEQLIKSTQMIGYAESLRLRYPTARFIRISHISYQTSKTRKAKKSTVLLPVEEVERRWYERGHSVAKQVRETIKAPSYEEVPKPKPNEKGIIEACTAYRGCSYQHICFKNPFARAKVIFASKRRSAKKEMSDVSGISQQKEGNMSSLLSKVKAKAAEVNGVSSVPLPTASAPAVTNAVPLPVSTGRKLVIKDESTTPDVPLSSRLTAKQAVQGTEYRLPNGSLAKYSTQIGTMFVFVDANNVPTMVGPDDFISVPPPPTPPVAAPAPAEVAAQTSEVAAPVDDKPAPKRLGRPPKASKESDTSDSFGQAADALIEALLSKLNGRKLTISIE